MEIISPIFSTIAEVIEKFADCIKDVFTNVVGLFYTAPTSSGGTGSLTVLGVLLLIAVGTGLVMWAFRTIRGLVRRA